MKFAAQKCQAAFTLLEIMIIVGLIGLLGALALPSYVKVRKQTQGKRILNDARIIDTAIDAWAMENNQTDGSQINLSQASQYTKTGVIKTNDVLGNPYVIGVVGQGQVQVAPTSKSALSGVAIDWGAY